MGCQQPPQFRELLNYHVGAELLRGVQHLVRDRAGLVWLVLPYPDRRKHELSKGPAPSAVARPQRYALPHIRAMHEMYAS